MGDRMEPDPAPERAVQNFIYRPGVMPKAALNMRVKWAWSAKAASLAVFCQGPCIAQPASGHVKAPRY